MFMVQKTATLGLEVADVHMEMLEMGLLVHAGHNMVPVERVGTLHSLVHACPGDVPAAKDEVVQVHHRENIANGGMDGVAREQVGAKAGNARAEEPVWLGC